MRSAITLNDFIFDSTPSFGDVAEHVVAAERLGVDTIWSAEAWGTDAVVPLAFVAARTSRMVLASGIMQVTARAPVMTAMTAMTLDHVSGGRFVLGLGVSGPQVVEGLHGQRYERPLERLRETVDVVRLAMSGEKIVYEGRQIVLPLPGGQGKAIRLGQPPRPGIPLHLATLGPKALEFTGAVADGWVGTCFVPERAAYFLDHLRAGAAAAGRSLDGFRITAGGPLAFTEDVERPMRGRKKALAFQLGAMGSPTTNFYNDAFSRIGFADAAERVRSLWLTGDRDAAVAAVPDELALRTSLYGTDAMIRDRIRAYRDAGVTDLRLEPMGRTAAERLDSLGRVVDLVQEVSGEVRRQALTET
jgi:F420-dependent oxidoreductase-like protein